MTDPAGLPADFRRQRAASIAGIAVASLLPLGSGSASIF